MNRREFLLSAAGYCGLMFLGSSATILFSSQENMARTRAIFSQIMARAKKERWNSLAIGECMAKIGLLFLGTDYVAGTLEGEGPEVCRVDLTGLDCVTFYENVLCLARILKKGKSGFEDFLADLTFTRYREGKLTDYTSRLHYTSDWIHDNEKKKVVKNITPEIGGEKLSVEVFYMSRNPEYYPALRQFPEFLRTIARIEEEINGRVHWFIPKKKVKKAQTHIQTGDIIAVVTSKEGLDYAHTGLAVRDRKGKLGFLHASQKEKKVVLDVELHKYLESVETYTGVTVARPIETGSGLQHSLELFV